MKRHSRLPHARETYNMLNVLTLSESGYLLLFFALWHSFVLIFFFSHATFQFRFWKKFRNNFAWSILQTPLTLSWWRSLSYRNQSIDMQSKSMDWFLYDRHQRNERVKWNRVQSVYISGPHNIQKHQNKQKLKHNCRRIFSVKY